jgi:hypothetical protein
MIAIELFFFSGVLWFATAFFLNFFCTMDNISEVKSILSERVPPISESSMLIGVGC